MSTNEDNPDFHVIICGYESLWPQTTTYYRICQDCYIQQNSQLEMILNYDIVNGEKLNNIDYWCIMCGAKLWHIIDTDFFSL